MARRKLLRPVPTRQGDRSRFNLVILSISLPVAFVALLGLYFAFFR